MNIAHANPLSVSGLGRIAPSWRLLGASVQGASHEKFGNPCQDAHRWVSTPSGVLVAAVADGAGSARHSAIGSAVAARVAVETLCDGRTLPLDLQDLSAWEMHLTEGLLAAVAAVEREAVIRHLSVDDLATTLILVAATPHGVVAIQVGDGAVVVDDQNGNLTTLTIPPRGEYLNETDFLSSSNLLHIAQGKFWAEPSRNIAIFSDGLEWLALQMPQMRPHVPFFEPFFNLVAESTETNAATKELIAFLQSPRVREKAKDDLTLA